MAYTKPCTKNINKKELRKPNWKYISICTYRLMINQRVQIYVNPSANYFTIYIISLKRYYCVGGLAFLYLLTLNMLHMLKSNCEFSLRKSSVVWAMYTRQVTPISFLSYQAFNTPLIKPIISQASLWVSLIATAASKSRRTRSVWSNI